MTVLAILCVAGIIFFVISMRFFAEQKPTGVEQASLFGSDLPQYDSESLKAYNGTNINLPIYIALDGYVYDVTEGKRFYASGGVYHSLAGHDASKELHVLGGDIIKEKYPVIGIFK